MSATMTRIKPPSVRQTKMLIDGKWVESRSGKRFTTFNLSEKAEQDDTCALGDKAWYHKSLLYLVARGLEPDPLPGKGFVPVIGLQLGLGEMIDGTRTMAQAIRTTPATAGSSSRPRRPRPRSTRTPTVTPTSTTIRRR